MAGRAATLSGPTKVALTDYGLASAAFPRGREGRYKASCSRHKGSQVVGLRTGRRASMTSHGLRQDRTSCSGRRWSATLKTIAALPASGRRSGKVATLAIPLFLVITATGAARRIGQRPHCERGVVFLPRPLRLLAPLIAIARRHN